MSNGYVIISRTLSNKAWFEADSKRAKGHKIVARSLFLNMMQKVEYSKEDSYC